MNDDIHWLMIGLEICNVVSEKPNLPDPCRLIDHTTDDDRREGIRRYFADTEELDEPTVEKALVLFKEWEAAQERNRRIADAILACVMPRAFA